MNTTVPAPTKNERLLAWVEEVAALTATRRDPLVRRLGGGVRPPLPGRSSRRARSSARPTPSARTPTSRCSDPGDVARVEDRTFICSETEARRRARPTTGATRPRCAATLHRPVRAARCAAARCTSCRSRWARSARDKRHIGVQLTDSAYVAVSMRIMTRMGQGALDALGERRRVRALPALGRHAARRRRAGRAVAVQRRQQVHRPLPRDARDLVLRLGLRRQRAARQEVLRAAHRLGDGARRGLDGRAHADPQADLARGRGQVHHRRVPERLRQDQPRDADPDARGLEGRDDRRRHRLDEVRRRRPALRDQPRGRLLRRRAGHRRGDEPERDPHDRAQHDLHQLRARPTTATSGGRA